MSVFAFFYRNVSRTFLQCIIRHVPGRLHIRNHAVCLHFVPAQKISRPVIYIQTVRQGFLCLCRIGHGNAVILRQGADCRLHSAYSVALLQKPPGFLRQTECLLPGQNIVLAANLCRLLCKGVVLYLDLLFLLPYLHDHGGADNSECQTYGSSRCSKAEDFL